MVGLAFANSCQWISHALIMLFLLYRTLDGLNTGEAALSVLRTLTAAAAAGALWMAVAPALMVLPNPIGLALGLAVAGGLGLLVYVGILRVLRAPEARVVTSRLSRLASRAR
jgi:hypothetical protein